MAQLPEKPRGIEISLGVEFETYGKSADAPSSLMPGRTPQEAGNGITQRLQSGQAGELGVNFSICWLLSNITKD